MAVSPLRIVSLCSGVGMHDLALGLVFRARTVCYVEREAFAASQLVALMEAGCMDAAPVWSDLATFDAGAWRGAVDCVVAGLPCQPYSVAGKRVGLSDHRSVGEGDGPLVQFVRIVAECQPAVVLVENVPAFVTGLAGEHGREYPWRDLGSELSELGYEIEDALFLAASDVGASHERERIWLLAYLPGRGQRVLRESWRGVGLVERDCGTVGNADDVGLHVADGPAWRSGGALANTGCGSDHAEQPIGFSERFGAAGVGSARADVEHTASAQRPRGAGRGLDGDRRSASRSGEGGHGVAFAHGQNGARGGAAVTRKDGKSRLDMLDWAAESFSRPDPATPAGPASSSAPRGSRRRLNPAFACWLMNLPSWWTNPGVTSSAQSEMAAYRCAQRSHLARLLGESLSDTED